MVKFNTLSGSITLLVDFVTLSGSNTLSGVYFIIGTKDYKWYISKYSSSFYCGHFEKGIRNPLGISNGFLARSNELKKNVYFIIGKIYYIIYDFITLSGSITLSGVYYIIGAKYYNWYISIYSSSFDGGHFENNYPNSTGRIKW